MGRAFLDFTATGASTYPIHALEWLDTAYLTALVNGTPVVATFDDARREVTFAAAPASGADIRIQRSTPRRREERLTQFLDLPTGQAGLTAALLDQDYLQLLHVINEGRDVADGLGEEAHGMMLGSSGHWASDALRIESLEPGVNPLDAINKSQLDILAAGVRNLPIVGVPDNDNGLFVEPDEWDNRTPAQARDHLGLGTVATLDAGVMATNVVQLDASARYPAASGELIDLTSHPVHLEIAKRALGTVVAFRRADQNGNGLDPTSGTWSQNSTSRYNTAGVTAWDARVELNNDGDLDGDFAPGRFDLSAGTWRVRWVFKARQTSSAANVGFRITDNDDTSGQTIYYDLGVHRIIRQFNAGSQYWAIQPDERIFKSASPFSLVFRWALTLAGGSNTSTLLVFFHKISDSAA